MFLEVQEGITENEERPRKESTGHAQRGEETKLTKEKANKGGALRGWKQSKAQRELARRQKCNYIFVSIH